MADQALNSIIEAIYFILPCLFFAGIVSIIFYSIKYVKYRKENDMKKLKLVLYITMGIIPLLIIMVIYAFSTMTFF